MRQLLSQPTPIIYPESDGKPIADNTKQFEYIATINGGLDAVFYDDPNVFVAGDLLWYPVEGSASICQAPDVMVAFGRAKGHRGSYLQWIEGGMAPQVVIEALSPNNTDSEMMRKFEFYQRYGVEEYYIYDPDRGDLCGYIRGGDQLRAIEQMQGHRSPRLGVRFDLADDELILFRPDGIRFLTYAQLSTLRDEQQHRADEQQRRAESAEGAAEKLRELLRA